MNEAIWKEVPAEDLQFNPFTLIGKEWMLVTAGDESAHNTLTASWGGLGVLWHKNVSYIVIRPQRHTMQFLEAQDYYSLSFFDKEYKGALSYCGSHSGRDVDKDKEAGLTAAFDEAAPYYQEARLVMICRKMAAQELGPTCFLDDSIDGEFYRQKDYHKLFIGAIEKVMVRE